MIQYAYCLCPLFISSTVYFPCDKSKSKRTGYADGIIKSPKEMCSSQVNLQYEIQTFGFKHPLIMSLMFFIHIPLNKATMYELAAVQNVNEDI